MKSLLFATCLTVFASAPLHAIELPVDEFAAIKKSQIQGGAYRGDGRSPGYWGAITNLFGSSKPKHSESRQEAAHITVYGRR